MSDISATTSDANPAAERGLDSCPVCNYSLAGLPDSHRCPECAFEYDEHTRVWRPQSFRKFAGRLYFASIVMNTSFVGLLILAARVNRTVFAIWQIIMISAVLILTFAFLIRGYRMRPFIALTPAGFYVRGRMGFRARLIAWHSIERVKAQFRQLDIIGLNQSLFPVARYAADDTDQAQAILNEIESAYLRHLDAQEMPELCPR